MASEQSAGDAPHPKICQRPPHPAVPAGPAAPQKELQGDNRVIWGRALKVLFPQTRRGRQRPAPRNVQFEFTDSDCRGINHSQNSSRGCCSNFVTFAKLPNVFS